MYRPMKFVALFLTTLAMAFSQAAGAEEKKPVNLLRLPAVKIEKSTVSADELKKLQALTDDDPATVSQIKAQGGSVDIVYDNGCSTHVGAKQVALVLSTPPSCNGAVGYGGLKDGAAVAPTDAEWGVLGDLANGLHIGALAI